MTATATTTIIHQIRDIDTGRVLHPSEYRKDLQVACRGTGPAPKPFGRIEAARWRCDAPEPSDVEWQRLRDLLEAGEKDRWRDEIERLGAEIVSMVVGRWVAVDVEGQRDVEGQPS